MPFVNSFADDVQLNDDGFILNNSDLYYLQYSLAFRGSNDHVTIFNINLRFIFIQKRTNAEQINGKPMEKIFTLIWC